MVGQPVVCRPRHGDGSHGFVVDSLSSPARSAGGRLVVICLAALVGPVIFHCFNAGVALWYYWTLLDAPTPRAHRARGRGVCPRTREDTPPEAGPEPGADRGAAADEPRRWLLNPALMNGGPGKAARPGGVEECAAGVSPAGVRWPASGT
jgi:hypothetical protein